jgi:nucleotide-binding universal stress UspA family protein
MYRRILAALEGKESDKAVVAHTRRLAAQMNAQVTLLRVIAVAEDGGGDASSSWRSVPVAGGGRTRPRRTCPDWSAGLA